MRVKTDPAVTTSATRGSASLAFGSAQTSCPYTESARTVAGVAVSESATTGPVDRGSEGGTAGTVRVTATGGRRLVGLVDALRAAPVAGVQLVWDGEDPTREEVEAHVFAALELARATPNGPPVVVTRSKAPIAALRALVAKRKDRSG